MSANSILAANKINADTAGQTSPKPAEPLPGEAAANNLVSSVTGSFSNLFSGGMHPENDPTPTADTSLQKASDSVRGVLGGLKPKATSVLAPGPAGSTNAAKAVEQGTKGITDAAGKGVNAGRKFLDRIKP